MPTPGGALCTPRFIVSPSREEDEEPALFPSEGAEAQQGGDRPQATSGSRGPASPARVARNRKAGGQREHNIHAEACGRVVTLKIHKRERPGPVFWLHCEKACLTSRTAGT